MPERKIDLSEVDAIAAQDKFWAARAYAFDVG
jgi:hypothetical protein